MGTGCSLPSFHIINKSLRFGVFQLNSNMTIEQKGDSSFQLLYPEDMEENDLEEATHIVSINK